MRTISIKLPRALEAKLLATARRRRTSKSAIVRDALQAYLSQDGHAPQPSLLDLVHDLVGCVKGGPPDLSTNKKYFEGFGK